MTSLLPSAASRRLAEYRPTTSPYDSRARPGGRGGKPVRGNSTPCPSNPDYGTEMDTMPGSTGATPNGSPRSGRASRQKIKMRVETV